MADLNGLSDNDKDTDTESLPEVTHSKPAKGITTNNNAWKLHQNHPGRVLVQKIPTVTLEASGFLL